MESEESLKVAVAMALLRRRHARKNDPSTATTPSDALRWKQKAKERKQELIKLRKEFRLAEDGMLGDLFPLNASCKCYFFDDIGKSSPKKFGDDLTGKFSDVLHQRFLRHVRLKERRKRRAGGSIKKLCFSDMDTNDEKEALKASADFLVELCETVCQEEEANFANWSHQAVEFILGSLKNLLLVEKNLEPVDGCINSLITRLVRIMSSPLQSVTDSLDADPLNYVQHLIRKLGKESYFGQRATLSVSLRICQLAQSLLFTDPFDNVFPSMHNSMYIMIQLVELLVSDSLSTWAEDERFDNAIFREWVASILRARKALEILENRNVIHVMYIDRVIGQLAKVVNQTASLRQLNQDVVDSLLN